jgi:hypothetical protein
MLWCQTHRFCQNTCAVRSVCVCVCVCVCICVCIRVLPFTTHVCDVLLCVRDRALHRVALAHGVFGRHAHGYTHTHAHMVDTNIINARTISPNSFSFRGFIGVHRVSTYPQQWLTAPVRRAIRQARLKEEDLWLNCERLKVLDCSSLICF